MLQSKAICGHKMHKKAFGDRALLGLQGELTAHPRPPAGFKGAGPGQGTTTTNPWIRHCICH